MRQYTTPTIPITVEGLDLTAFSVWVTFTQGSHVLTIEDPTMELDVDGNTVLSVELGQCQTAGFRVGMAKVQVNWINQYGKRDATEEGVLPVDGNLLDRVLP